MATGAGDSAGAGGSVGVETLTVAQETPSRGWWARVASFCDTDAGAIAALVVLVVLAFSPWWAGGRYFAPLDLLNGLYEPWRAPDAPIEVHNHFTSDGVTQYLIYHKIAERSYAEDGRVGWSDLTMGGRPEYANTMAGYDDWTMQLHRFLDYWTAWHLGLLAQCLIAGLGLFVFLRSRGISPAVSLVAAVAYVANSQFIMLFYIRSPLAGFAWVPWVVWGMESYRSGRRWAWPLVPLFLALAFLGGTMQTSAFVALVVLGVWLGGLVETGDAAGGGWRARLRYTGHCLAWGVLGAGLAAFALVPNALTLAESMAQGMNRGQIGYAGGLLQPVLSALLIPVQAFPTLLGSPRSMDLAKLLELDLHAVAYFGFIPVVLAYRAALHRGAPAAARWVIALGLLIPLTPLVGPLYHRVQLVFIFGGAWAFAWYWEHADQAAVERLLRWLFPTLLVVTIAWVAASLATLVFHDSLQARIDGYIAGRIASGQAGVFGEQREGWLLERGRQLLTELRIWHPRQAVALGGALLGCAALWLRNRRGPALSAVALLAVLLVELGAFAGGWLTVVDPAEHPPYAETADIAELRERVGEGRVYIVDHPSAPSFFPPNTLAMYGVATIQAYETVGLMTIWTGFDEADDPVTLGAVGVTHAVARPGVEMGEGWTLEFEGDRLTLWRNEFALPRYLALREESDAWSRMILNEVGEVAVGPVRAEGTMNRRRLEVPPGTRAVRIAENWSEGWRYRVDGEAWRPVEMARDRSMVLEVDSQSSSGTGSRVVELEYRPRRRVIGWWVTGVAVLSLALGGAVSWRAGRIPPRPRPAGPPPFG